MLVPGSVNPLLLTSAAGAAGGGVSRSIRLNAPDSANLSRTPGSAGTSRTTWTVSFWAKRAALAATQWLFFSSDLSANTTGAYFTSSDTLEFYEFQSGSYVSRLITTQVFRDPSAWYNLVFTWDTDNGTSTNRVRIYVNGVRIDTFSTSSYPSSGVQSRWNNNVEHYFGRGVGSEYFSGYLADIYFIDGQALTPSSFTETDATTGQLVPKAFSGSYGTNGFHLEFSDNSGTTSTTLGKDSAGSNNWTPNNFSVSSGAGNDSLVDVPTNGAQTDTGVGGEVRGNYAVLNPLSIGYTSAQGLNSTIIDGNLQFSCTNGAGAAPHNNAVSTIGVSSGKWYAEFLCSAFGSTYPAVGIVAASRNRLATANAYIGNYPDGYAYAASGLKGNNDTYVSYGASYTTGDLIGVALDLDAGTLVFYKNGTSQGTAYTGLSGTFLFAVANWASGVWIANFGQRAFAYTAPSGFKALCTANLPAPLVTKPSTVMDILLWTGTGTGADRTISGLGFSNTPGLIWGKGRSAAYHHTLWDIVRGYGLTNVLSSDRTEGQGWTASGRIKTATSSSITWEADSGSLWYDGSSTTYAAWAWDAGSSTVTNNVGSITSSVRANATAGFSVCTFSVTTAGSISTFGTGLGASPEFVIIKPRNATTDWAVFHGSATSTPLRTRLLLNSTGAVTNYGSDVWSRSSTTLGVDTSILAAPGTAIDCVAYCFAPVVGYSSAFSFTGNGSSDGPFCFLGFRPRLILAKRSDGGSENWYLIDSARGAYNVNDKLLNPNTSAAEETYSQVDFLSNGFKIRNTGTGMNANGATMIGFAWAESPFNYARAR